MRYFVNVSGGTASAVAADRAIARHGLDAVDLWFADTSWEDADLYRFLTDLETFWGKNINRHVDGRTPLEVAEQRSMIPNARMAPCSYELKVKPLREIMAALPKPITQLMGLDWRELHRVRRVQARHLDAGIDGVSLDFPLLWKPYELRPYYGVVSSWGVTPPRAYRQGLSHSNCGGRCVRQGIGEWLKLRRVLPERFAEMRDWEQAQRAKGGARAKASMLLDRIGGDNKPLTLAVLDARHPEQDELFSGTPDDMSSCFCNDWEGVAP